jgi:flagellin-like protein
MNTPVSFKLSFINSSANYSFRKPSKSRKEKIFKLLLTKSEMEKKGISPVIATLLLVAVVISLSSIVFIWARGFIGEAIQKNDMPAEQACEGISLSASYYASDGRLQISNNGDVSVSKLGVSVESGGEFSEEEKDTKVLAGDSVEIVIASGGTNVEVVPWILGEKSGNIRDYYKCENVVVRAELM